MVGLICFMGGPIDPGGREARISFKLDTLCELSANKTLARTLKIRSWIPMCV
jgi:hypothetical protein